MAANSDPGPNKDNQTKPKKIQAFKSTKVYSMEEPLSPSSQGMSFHTSS